MKRPSVLILERDELGNPALVRITDGEFAGCEFEGPSYTSDTIECEEIWEAMIFESVCDALDGCIVEPDGHCPHGLPSWLILAGLI